MAERGSAIVQTPNEAQAGSTRLFIACRAALQVAEDQARIIRAPPLP
jgi:hypothetical protein